MKWGREADGGPTRGWSRDPLVRPRRGRRARQLDQRSLPPTATTSQIRYDAVLDEWVAIASHRQTAHSCRRRTCARSARHARVASPRSHPTTTTSWSSRTVSLRSPPTSLACKQPPKRAAVRHPTRARAVRGRVLHQRPLRLVRAAEPRPSSPRRGCVGGSHGRAQRPGATSSRCTRSRTAGSRSASHSHPHGQIYAYPFVPPRTRRMLDSARRHRERTWGNLFADLLAAERDPASGWCPRVSTGRRSCRRPPRWPVEVHLYPHRHVPDIPALSDAERDDFARALPRRPAPPRRVLRPAPAVHRCLAAGAGARGSSLPTSTCRCSRSVAPPAS